MQRPALTTLACITADCQQFGRTGQDNLTMRKVYGKDGIRLRVVRGKAQLLHTLSLLGYDKINTSSVERQNGTRRLRNQRKVRRTLAFSTSHRYHGWMSWFSVVQYNFCRAHGSLRIKEERGFHHRTPAMASGLTDRIWSTRDWLLSPVLGGRDNHRTRPCQKPSPSSR